MSKQTQSQKGKDEKAKLEIAEQAKTHEQEQNVYRLGMDIAKSTLQLGGLWFSLCLYIREESVPPKVVSKQLAAVGFKRSRISEVNRVANSPDAVWSEYAARAIGFRAALELVRDGKPTAIAEECLGDGELQDAIEIEAETGQDSGGGGEGKGEGSSPKDKEAKDAEALHRAVKTIFQRMGALNKRSLTVRSDKFVLKVTQSKAAKKKGN